MDRQEQVEKLEEIIESAMTMGGTYHVDDLYAHSEQIANALINAGYVLPVPQEERREQLVNLVSRFLDPTDKHGEREISQATLMLSGSILQLIQPAPEIQFNPDYLDFQKGVEAGKVTEFERLKNDVMKFIGDWQDEHVTNATFLKSLLRYFEKRKVDTSALKQGGEKDR